jgi:hypothetical protein
VLKTLMRYKMKGSRIKIKGGTEVKMDVAYINY